MKTIPSIILSVLVASGVISGGTGCSGHSAQPVAATAPIAPEASSPSAIGHRMVEQGALLLDVRTPEEYAAGHLQTAVNIPVGELSSRMAEVGDHAHPVVVYCAHGTRAAKAAELLTGAGFSKVHSLGGMDAW